MVREKKSAPLSKNKKAAAAASKSSPLKSAPTPPPPPPSSAPVAPPISQPKQPGLLAQAASTAGGVAIGSSVGHAIGNMFSGSGSKSSSNEQSAIPAGSNVTDKKSDVQNGPCEFEIRQLMDCINRQPELNACQSFFETLKQCRTSKGLQQ